MKLSDKIWGLGIGILFFTSVANAGTTVCAGPSVHYSFKQVDFGMRSRNGVYSGERFLSINGKLKEHQTFFFRQPPSGTWNLQLEFSNEALLSTTGNPSKGQKVYSANLVVKESNGEVSAQEAVICKETWSLPR